MTTAAEIVQDASIFAGTGDVYNALDANNAALSLRVLNDLLDSESTQEYSIFDIIEGTFPLVAGQQNYIVGPVNLLSVRPIEIETLNIVDATNVSHPVQLIGVDQWANNIIYKPAPGRPEYCYVTIGPTTWTLQFWPLPSFANDVVHVWYWSALQSFATLAGTLAMPAGYAWFLKTALGMSLMAMNQRTPTPEQKEIAWVARKNARALNRQSKVLGLDLPVSDRNAFNIFTGNTNP
jgi:hypothetical protein